MQNKTKLIVILGPTASGKSRLALSLAKKFNGYIISADSRQVYKDMDIGTDKIHGRKTRVAGIPAVNVDGVYHFLIDIKKPSQTWTLAHFQKEVYRITKKLRSHPPFKTKTPFLVGGTGLYISAIVENWNLPKEKPNLALRRTLDKKSLVALVRELKKRDPASARTIDLKNKRRVVRALEYVRMTGESFHQSQKRRAPRFEILQLGMNVPLKTLEGRIHSRVHDMIARGLVREVKKLAKTYSRKAPAMSGIGYNEIGQYLRDEISLTEALARIKRNTRRYAKRQMTWFKRDTTIHWIKTASSAAALTRRFLSH